MGWTWTCPLEHSVFLHWGKEVVRQFFKNNIPSTCSLFFHRTLSPFRSYYHRKVHTWAEYSKYWGDICTNFRGREMIRLWKCQNQSTNPGGDQTPHIPHLPPSTPQVCEAVKNESKEQEGERKGEYVRSTGRKKRRNNCFSVSWKDFSSKDRDCNYLWI